MPKPIVMDFAFVPGGDLVSSEIVCETTVTRKGILTITDYRLGFDETGQGHMISGMYAITRFQPHTLWEQLKFVFGRRD